MKIVTDIDGNKFTVEDASLTPYVGGPQKRAKIMKSFRTEEGANVHLKALGSRLEGAIIVKSLGGYDECCDPMGAPMPVMPSQPVHIIVEEDMGVVADSVSVKNADDMFKEMYKKGLLEASGGGLYTSAKFHDLLMQYTEQAMAAYMKSASPEAELTEAGTPMIDVLTEAYEVLKASGPSKLALSQEEASNTDGEARTEGLGDQKGTAEEARGGQVSGGGDSSPETQGLSQEEADAKNAGERKIAISDAEVKSKMGDIQIMKDAYVFKSLSEAQTFARKNPEYNIIEPTTVYEKNQNGKRYTFAARHKNVSSPHIRK